MKFNEALGLFPLFKGIEIDALEKCLSDIDILCRSYKRGDSIFSPDNYTNDVGIVLSGECEITQIGKDGAGLELKKIGRGDGFGVLSVLLNGEDFPTYIYAKRATEIAFISKSDFLKLLENPKVARNMIEFLAERVSFLNKKIATISAGAVEDKLSRYLVGLYDQFGSTIDGFNKQNVAKILGAGRASLYRALTSLSEKGAIEIEKNSLKIINIEKLKG